MDRSRSASPAVRVADDEAALVARLKAGEEAAYEELLRVHGPRMLAVARRYLAQAADAEDVLQDAFVSVSRGIGGFAGGSRLDTWLHRVTVNAALMRLRWKRRRPEAPAEAYVVEEAATGAHGTRVPLAALETLARGELRARVRASLERVPEAYRTVVMLRDLEGMEFEEIGRLLEASVSSVKIRLHRGRHILRILLSSEEGEA